MIPPQRTKATEYRKPKRINAVSVTMMLFLGAAGCREPERTRVLEPGPEPAFVDAGAELPRVRFGDGQVSLNDRCAVRRVKLNLRMPPAYVNGRPIGFC